MPLGLQVQVMKHVAALRRSNPLDRCNIERERIETKL